MRRLGSRFYQRYITTILSVNKDLTRLLAQGIDHLGGVFPKWDEMCARREIPPERLTPFVNASSIRINGLLINGLTQSPSTDCFQSWSLFFEAGHVKKVGQLFTQAHSTVYQSRLNCLESRSTVEENRLNCLWKHAHFFLSMQAPIFTNTGSTVYDCSFNHNRLDRVRKKAELFTKAGQLFTEAGWLPPWTIDHCIYPVTTNTNLNSHLGFPDLWDRRG